MVSIQEGKTPTKPYKNLDYFLDTEVVDKSIIKKQLFINCANALQMEHSN